MLKSKSKIQRASKGFQNFDKTQKPRTYILIIAVAETKNIIHQHPNLIHAKIKVQGHPDRKNKPDISNHQVDSQEIIMASTVQGFQINWGKSHKARSTEKKAKSKHDILTKNEE